MGTASTFGIKVIRNYTNYEQCSCPYHVDHSPSAVYLKNENVFYCYSCHRRKTMSELAKDFKLTADDYGLVEGADSGVMLPAFNDEANNHFESFMSIHFSKEGIKYLNERRISLELATNLGMEYSVKHEGVVFPQFMGKKRIGNVIRLLNGKSNARYLIEGKIEPLWNMRFYDMFKEFLIISEGAFKAMAIKMACDANGIDGVISMCTFGARTNIGTDEIIDQFKGTVIMIGDNDRAGVTFGQKMKKKGIKVIVPKIPFDDMTIEQRCGTMDTIMQRIKYAEDIES